MHYAILCYEKQADFDIRNDPAKAGDYWAGWSAYSAAVSQAAIFVSGAGLMPPASATSLKTRDGKKLVQDGPYADAKEQLGGFFVIDVPDLDAALEWASKAPTTRTGSTEVRPLLPPMAG